MTNIPPTWLLALSRLRRYRATHGHVRVPRPYRDADGHPLGEWVKTQRARHRLVTTDPRRDLLPLHPDQIRLLNELGMIWEPPGSASARAERSFTRGITELTHYHKREGHSRVPSLYRTPDNYGLGHWVMIQRQRYRLNRGIRPRHKSNLTPLTPTQIQALDKLDMIWEPTHDRHPINREAFHKGLARVAEYREQHGHSDVPNRYRNDDGYHLGKWLSVQRARYRLTTQGTTLATPHTGLLPHEIQALEDLGINWNPPSGRTSGAAPRAGGQPHTPDDGRHLGHDEPLLAAFHPATIHDDPRPDIVITAKPDAKPWNAQHGCHVSAGRTE